MMKTKIVILMALTGTMLFGQYNVFLGVKDITYPQKEGIYETEKDFIENNVKYVGKYNEALTKEVSKVHFNVVNHGNSVNFGQTYYNLDDATFFGYQDDMGNKIRVVKGWRYNVRACGAKWLYTRHYNNQIDPWDKQKKKIIKADDGNLPEIYYSIGASNELIEIKKWTKKASAEVNEKLFADDPDISAQYMADEKKDYYPEYNSLNALERIIYYTDLYNKKHQTKN